MDRGEVDRLFRLLGTYYPGARQTRDREVRLAWALALENTGYEEARAAVAAYAGRGKYFPDLWDLGLAPREPRDEDKAAYGARVRAHLAAKAAAAGREREREGER